MRLLLLFLVVFVVQIVIVKVVLIFVLIQVVVLIFILAFIVQVKVVFIFEVFFVVLIQLIVIIESGGGRPHFAPAPIFRNERSAGHERIRSGPDGATLPGFAVGVGRNRLQIQVDIATTGDEYGVGKQTPGMTKIAPKSGNSDRPEARAFPFTVEKKDGGLLICMRLQSHCLDLSVENLVPLGAVSIQDHRCRKTRRRNFPLSRC